MSATIQLSNAWPDDRHSTTEITRTELIAALKSGRYRQTHGYLFRIVEDNGQKVMCGLGVLCDLRGREWRRYNRAGEAPVYAYEIENHGLHWGVPHLGDLPAWMSEEMMHDLMLVNDVSAVEGFTDYSKVIERLEDEAWIYERTPIEWLMSRT
jgi:hypothetical protein